jgi:hypothetical protein
MVWQTITYLLICGFSMKRNKKPYNVFHKISSVFLMITLAWLTISTPFVASFQQEMAKQGISKNTAPTSSNEEDTSNPFGNNTEEKPASGSSVSLAEEYLHDNHKAEYLLSVTSNYYKSENAGTYTAFHGELLVPPPNFS